MDKLDEQLNNLSLVEVPSGMHQFVMQKINHKKLQPILLSAFALLTFNFIIIVWHINTKLIEVEFTDMVQDFFEVFSFNLSFINTVLISFFEIISPLLIISAISSLVGVVYTGSKIKLFYNFNRV